MGKLLRPGEVAEIVGVSKYTLQAWRRQGYFVPWVRLRGNQVRYAEDRVREWVRAHEVSSIAEERARGRKYNGAAEDGGFR